MNDLTLFLYVTELVDRLGLVVGLSAIVLFLAAFLLPPKGVEIFGMDHHGPFMGLERLKGFIIAWSILLVISLFTPSKETLYLMAASEAGEAVATSPDGRQMLDKLKVVINNQLDKLAKGK